MSENEKARKEREGRVAQMAQVGLPQKMFKLIQKYNAVKGSVMGLNELLLVLETEINELQAMLKVLMTDSKEP